MMINVGDTAIISRSSFDLLLDALAKKGYQIIGPTLQNQAIVYDEIHSTRELPIGWTDEQDGGKYRVKKRDDAAVFGYAVGPHSWKKYLLTPRTLLWKTERKDTGFSVSAPQPDTTKRAFIGVRSCELHAIAIQDRILIHDKYVDHKYAEKRENVFIVALNCGTSGGTCFCVSMKTGPNVTLAHDLALTEILDSNKHEFLVQVGSEQGKEILSQISHQPASTQDLEQGKQIVENTAKSMGRQMQSSDLKELLYRNLEHAEWDRVAERCLACGNCTQVCPTCFCTDHEDKTDMTGKTSEHWRRWDSCFTLGHSYTHGGAGHPTIKSRYRQWMTHKLATWVDQFGTSGCVGCGRCITWCPVGIDITEEVAAIRKTEETTHGESHGTNQ